MEGVSSVGGSPAAKSVGDLEQVAERVTHDRPAIAVRRVEGCFDDRCAGGNGPLVHGIDVVDVDVQERREEVALTGFGTISKESPILSSAGRPSTTSPLASKTSRRN